MNHQQLNYLIEFLDFVSLRENRIHQVFDFSCFNKDEYNNHVASRGTYGCIFGELPGFDKNVKFGENMGRYICFLYNGESIKPAALAKHLFGLNEDEFKHLFIAHHQKQSMGGQKLYTNSVIKEVIFNFKPFIAYAKKKYDLY